jgi:hypothetical protein
MTAVAAIAAILILRDRTVFSAKVFIFSSEIIAMASGAVGRVLGPAKRNVFVIVVVAGATAQVSAVVTRVVTVIGVREIDRRPALRGMTIITFRHGNKMIKWTLRFTANRRIAVMARRATIGNSLVIKYAADEGCGGMTDGAIQAGRYVIRRKSAGRHAMAGRAIVDDAGVIERGRDKCSRVMADATILVGRKMVSVFRFGKPGGMTGRAVVHDANMIKRGRYKTSGYVTIDAVTVSRHMVIVLSSGGCTVTGSAIIHDVPVIERGSREDRGGMAHRAILVRWYVRGVDPGFFADRSITVMTRGAVIHDAGVVEHRRRKRAAGHVTDSAILRCYHMVRLGGLAGCIGAVVAGLATVTNNARTVMIDKRVGEIGRVVAYGTVPAGVLMNRRISHPQGTEQNKIGAAVMARRTIISDIDMAEYRRPESGNRVAIVTILIRWQMVGCPNQLRLGGKEAADMAAFATARNVLMSSR